MNESDQAGMARALQLALRGQGLVEPNPMVGCVISRGGRVLGEAYHRRFGGPHAEIEALRNCRGRTEGATAFVTLEPCAHFGKTPPCADALIAAGIRRVLIGARDPHPLVNGKGIARLRKAGVHVEVLRRRGARGVSAQNTAETGEELAESARELIAPFATTVIHGRPYVIAKWAQSIDGSLASVSGESKWISCPESRRRVHELRARVDAIVVGAATARADDPMLTARDVKLKRVARRVVLDGRLRIALSSALVSTADTTPTMVFTTQSRARSATARILQRRGLEVVGVRARGFRLDLAHCLAALHDLNATNVLVEGGPTLLGSFLAENLIDEARVFVAPVLLGGARRMGLCGFGGPKVADAAVPRRVSTTQSGRDIEYRLRFEPV